jgi:uncharacterized membrane-anchored protein
MRNKLTHSLVAALALFIAAPAFADGPGQAGPDTAAPPVRAAPIERTDPAAAPEGRSGIVPLGDAASLNVPSGYRFYSAEEAYAYLQRNNAAAPSGTVYGLVARADADIRQPGTWATVISYDAIGYVQPETASGLSDANFEADVRAARSSQNRAFEGFIAEPAFDAAAPALGWAERSAAPGAGGGDLRHEQKVLGRNGVACLTSIGSADQLDEIVAAAGDLRGMLSFPEGQRHADFQPASDQVSAYSVPGLVTGVAAAESQALANVSGGGQTGFGGLAGWFPWVAFGVVLLAGAGYLMMRRRKDEEPEGA